MFWLQLSAVMNWLAGPVVVMLACPVVVRCTV
jgi:hypothetical protein